MPQQPTATQFSDTSPDDDVLYPYSVPAAFAAAGVQSAAIADPTGGATIDAECRTAVTAVIAALEKAGITLA